MWVRIVEPRKDVRLKRGAVVDKGWGGMRKESIMWRRPLRKGRS